MTGMMGPDYTERDLLHVALELVDGALVQVAAEQREEVGGEEQRLHQGALGQLARHLEDGVRPGRFKKPHKKP